MLEYLDVATKTTLHQIFFGFILVFLAALFINRTGRRLRDILSSKLGDFYDYLVLPGCMCHEMGRTLGCLITGTGFDRFEIFNLKTDDSERVPVAVNVNSRLAFLKRFVILTGPVWLGSLVVCVIAVCAAGASFLPSYSASFPNEDVGAFDYVTTLLVEAVSMVASMVFVWHWTSPFCLVVFYLLFCVGSQIKISAKSCLLIWQSILCVFLILFLLNLIPGLNTAIAYAGKLIMPAVFVLHATLFFVAMLNFAFYILARIVLGNGRGGRGGSDRGTSAGIYIRAR